METTKTVEITLESREALRSLYAVLALCKIGIRDGMDATNSFLPETISLSTAIAESLVVEQENEIAEENKRADAREEVSA